MVDIIHSEEFKQKCKNLHLDYDTILKHHDRVKKVLQENYISTFLVVDTCRRDNLGIIDISKICESFVDEIPSGFLAFIPAAGVSSRYFGVLSKFKEKLALKDVEGLREELFILEEKGAKNWILPPNLEKLFSLRNEDFNFLSDQDFLDISSKAVAETNVPKAFLPCDKQHSFLERKLLEHELTSSIEAQVFIVGVGRTEDFARLSKSLEFKKEKLFLEQSPTLSTIRFDRNADPVIEDDGSLSMVPAGHGVLTSLLWEAKQHFPKLHSAFIKNIDNVVPVDESSQYWHRVFLLFHQKLVDSIGKVRMYLKDYDFKKASEVVKDLLDKFSHDLIIRDSTQEFLDKIEDPHRKLLWMFLCGFFHFDPNLIEDVFENKNQDDLLLYLYSRPVNTMGQVVNSDKNVGGTPVFVRYMNSIIKMCLEVAHASQQDIDIYFKDNSKATHFNPVFMAAELSFEKDHYNRYDDKFWILAKKFYKAKPVYYHESVLYELLGNTIMANVVFVEIPRFLFNPHKTIDSNGV